MNNRLVLYWCPFISKVATVKAVLNSAFGLKKYSKGKYQSEIINVFGEWDIFKDEILEKKINFSDKLISLNFLKFDLKGFLFSRIKYSLILIFAFFPLIYLLKKKKPEFLIVHLVTSLPLIIFSLFNFNTKLILRISGFPQLNFHRNLLWKFASKNIYKITCPTQETYQRFNKIKELKDKIYLLQDPIISILEINEKKKEKISINLPKKDFILSIGRLTRQKNFVFLLENYAKLKLSTIDLVIIGNGELKETLIKKTRELKIENNVFFIDYSKNIFNILCKCKFFLLTSLWEDPGFVLIEAAFMNKTILSSDCASGPKEILLNGKGGFLFKSNNSQDFLEKFKNLIDSDESMLKEKKFIAKLMTKEFTLFRHYKKLHNLLNI